MKTLFKTFVKVCLLGKAGLRNEDIEKIGVNIA